MKRMMLATAACLALAGCSQDRPAERSESAPPPANDAAPASGAAADRAASEAAPPSIAPAPQNASPPPVSTGSSTAEVETPAAPELAYAYRYQLEAPEARVPGLMRRHERACVLAGTSTCQLLGAETSVDEESGKTGGELRLRAVPTWIEEFRDQLDEDALDVDGRVVSAQTGAEDLSAQLGDERAVVTGLRGERDRMAQRLRVFRGSLEDRQKLERDLEAAQAELDAATRSLGTTSAQVVMATMSVSYRASEGAPASGTFAPVSEAARGFGGIVANALGIVITLGGVLLIPGLIVGAIWGGARWLKRRRARPTSAA